MGKFGPLVDGHAPDPIVFDCGPRRLVWDTFHLPKKNHPNFPARTPKLVLWQFFANFYVKRRQICDFMNENPAEL